MSLFRRKAYDFLERWADRHGQTALLECALQQVQPRFQLAGLSPCGAEVHVVRDPKRPWKATEDAGNFSPRAHEALNKLLATPDYGIEKGYVLSRLNVEQQDNVIYLPWYAAACFPEMLGLRKRVDEEVCSP